jgi:hypothetical protein
VKAVAEVGAAVEGPGVEEDAAATAAVEVVDAAVVDPAGVEEEAATNLTLRSLRHFTFGSEFERRDSIFLRV